MSEIKPPDKTSEAQWEHFSDSVKDLMNANAGDELGAAIASMQQAAAGLDSTAWLNALHVPKDAGEHEAVLESMLRRIPDNWGRWIGCGKGWYPLIVQLDEKLRELFPAYEIHQVKEKYGTLRFYWSAGEAKAPGKDFDFSHVDGHKAYRAWTEKTDEGRAFADERKRRYEVASRLVDAAEEASAGICEVCAGAGKLRMTQAASPWYRTVCDEHALDKDGNVTCLPEDEWEAWWEQEKPRFEARQREYELGRWEGKRALVIGESERELALDHVKVTDPDEAARMAGEDWDGVWFAPGEASQAFIDAYSARHVDHLARIERELEQARKEGKGYGYPTPEGAPAVYVMDDGVDYKSLQSLGICTMFARSSQLRA
jgi:hypothetical protein